MITIAAARGPGSAGAIMTTIMTVVVVKAIAVMAATAPVTAVAAVAAALAVAAAALAAAPALAVVPLLVQRDSGTRNPCHLTKCSREPNYDPLRRVILLFRRLGPSTETSFPAENGEGIMIEDDLCSCYLC
jgi:hypothetical protein